MSESLFEYQDTHVWTSLRITREEVKLNGISIPISDITDVIFYPIVQNERGLGGWIKFVTAKRPELPEKDYQKGWKIRCDGKEFTGSGTILSDINCFGYGCGWGMNDWKTANETMEPAVRLVRQLIGKE